MIIYEKVCYLDFKKLKKRILCKKKLKLFKIMIIKHLKSIDKVVISRLLAILYSPYFTNKYILLNSRFLLKSILYCYPSSLLLFKFYDKC